MPTHCSEVRSKLSSLNVGIVGCEVEGPNSQFDTYSLQHRLEHFAHAGAFRSSFEFNRQPAHPVAPGRIARLIEQLARFFRIVGYS